ncbi:MAG: VTC domain-containing protein [Kordiimonadaceae bacterium]|nr:VTC domain-containing protein [Kordiimonadaceae bacterium]MBT6036477.1 VTC domain-containing protein [Kordiimonadaceae bacterium]MBT6329376.1 VTC domain-containing protein [Kordiimonadaceae bacterium]
MKPTDVSSAFETRLETKWAVEKAKLPYIYTLLKENGFTPLYEPRKIYSVYYDYLRFNLYWLGEEGIVPRQKYRVRWYHKLDGFKSSARHEMKVTGMTGRQKASADFHDLSLAALDSRLTAMINQARVKRLCPVTLVNYTRKYFGDGNGRRMTLDMDIQYSRVKSFDRDRLNISNTVQDDTHVMELKSAMTLDALKISEDIALTKSRFSKYGRSINFTKLILSAE